MITAPHPANVRARSVFERGFELFTSVLNAIGTVVIISMITLMVGDVMGRFLFKSPIAGTNELVELSIVSILFLQVPHALRNNAIARSDLLERVLLKGAPKTLPYLNMVFALLGAFTFCVLVWAIIPVLLRDIYTHSQVGIPGVFLLPIWPVRLVVMVGAAATFIQFILVFFENMRTARGTDHG